MRDTCTSIADKVILVFLFFYDPFSVWEKIITIGTKMIVAHAKYKESDQLWLVTVYW